MLKKMALALAALTIFMVVPTLAGPATGCNKIKFVGSYTSPSTIPDIFGPGSNPPPISHNYLYQLNLNSDGTATQSWTGYADYMINTGTQSQQIGSWTCRADGKLIVTLIQALFAPVPAGAANGNLATPDVELWRHYRTTYLFSVDDVNTLTKIQSRSRTYTSAEDPTDAAGGTLQNPNNSTATYQRLMSSDADLLAPVTP
jgi:hypothetical protein